MDFLFGHDLNITKTSMIVIFPIKTIVMGSDISIRGVMSAANKANIQR